MRISLLTCGALCYICDVVIRDETPADYDRIDVVLRQSFDGEVEAALVRQLRSDGHLLLSLVDDEVRGYCGFSRMFVDTPDRSVPAVALAPVGVLPEHQRQGVGSALIRHGLDRLRNIGEGVVIVVGEPGYYTRFGFAHEPVSYLQSPFPAEFFMALELTPGALDGVKGPVRYAPAFGL